MCVLNRLLGIQTHIDNGNEHFKIKMYVCVVSVLITENTKNYVKLNICATKYVKNNMKTKTKR